MLIAIGLGLCPTQESIAANSGQNIPSFSATVAEVSNGHSLTVLLEKVPIKVRLWGVKSPGKGQPFAREARSAIQQLCSGKKVVVSAASVQRSGLMVAKVRVDGQGWLHEILLSRGLVWWDENEAPNADRLKILQESAQRAKRGIWSKGNARSFMDRGEKKAKPKKERLRKGKTKIKKSVEQPLGSPSSTVVITAKGRSYHEIDCRKIKEPSYRITLIRAREKSYKPCSVCKPPR